MNYCDKVVKLLADITHLHTLACPLLVGLELLPQRHSLKCLKINVLVEDSGHAAQSAFSSTLTLLQTATQLTRVCLRTPRLDDSLWTMGLIKALGHSRQSAISCLEFEMWRTSDDQMRDILNIVSTLPLLEKLTVGCVTPYILSALQPGTIPKLIELSVETVEDCCPCCSWRMPESDLQAALCAVIIRHHASLGRLKTIDISEEESYSEFGSDSDAESYPERVHISSAGLNVLLASIMSVEGLTCLIISTDIKRI
ncbi:uncharacterized protein LOC127752021, partial [Frankliniella occidentalis]|uniref:Uncharacterized protein LOC127752021 n=1 Tax=Frankliniella occidentalis TaxID=133901 RepID=A0A9C6XCA7_FRAOC